MCSLLLLIKLLSSSWPWPWSTWSLTFLTWSPTWPNLPLADLVTNLTKPSLNLDKSGPEVDTIIKQTTPPHHPTRQLLKGVNLACLLSDCSEFQREELDRHYNQTGLILPGGGVVASLIIGSIQFFPLKFWAVRE